MATISHQSHALASPIAAKAPATTTRGVPQTPPGTPPRQSTSPAQSLKTPPVLASYFTPSWYAKMDETIREVDQYFLDRWAFGSEKARKKFVAAGFSRVTCMYYPEALAERIGFACKLLTILFLIDDILEDMSFEEGEAYNASLMPIMRGDKLPDHSKADEYIMWDLWWEMRQCDAELANSILEPVFVFMRAQTDKTRKNIKGLGSYLLYRERDVGKALLSALMRFSLNLRLTPEELVLVKPVDENCSKHISVINDIFSWEKELAQSQSGHEEGSVLCSSVQVLADEANMSIPASKRVLFAMCREWELVHIELVQSIITNASLDEDRRESILSYVKGLEYQMSGNELWSASTLRYIGAGSEVTF